MGMSASQARLLSLTARLTNLEHQAQSISNSKIRLADQGSEVSQNYQNALNAEKLTVYNPNTSNYIEATAYNLTTYGAISDLDKQRMLEDSLGRILIPVNIGNAYEGSGNDLETFLNNLGLSSFNSEEDKVSSIKDPLMAALNDEITNNDGTKIDNSITETTVLSPSADYEILLQQANDDAAAYASLGITAEAAAANYQAATDVYNPLKEILDNAEIEKNTTDEAYNTAIADKETANGGLERASRMASISTAIADSAESTKTSAEEAYNTSIAEAAATELELQKEIKTYGEATIMSIVAPSLITKLAARKTAEASAKKINALTQTFNEAKAKVETAQIDKNNAEEAYNTAIADKESAESNLQRASRMYSISSAIADSAEANKNIADEAYNTALVNEQAAGQNLRQAARTSRVASISKAKAETSAQVATEAATAVTTIYTSNNMEDVNNSGSSDDEMMSTLTNIKSILESFNASFTDSSGNINSYISSLENLINSGSDGYSTDDGVGSTSGGELEQIQTFLSNFINNITNVTDNASLTGKYNYDSAEAEYYTNIFNQMQSNGYTTIDQENMNDNDWLTTQLKAGNVFLVEYNKTGGSKGTGSWDQISYASGDSTLQMADDKTKIARAEADYNTQMASIQSKDKRFDLELKSIDTEHNAAQTEIESVKKVIDKNIEKSFKIFNA